MSLFRRQPPARSPVSLGAIWAGLRAVSDRGALDRLERSLRAEYGAHEALLVASGTVALALAIRATAGRGRPPRVALPAYGCYDLATAADGADAEVLLYDVDPVTLGPEPGSFGRALGAGADAVVLVHLFGVPVAAEFMSEARKSGALVIDDAAQGQGGSLGGVPLGSLGDLGVLSFGRGKGRTGGGGGALLATSAQGAEAIAQVAPLVGPGGRGAFASLVGLAGQWALGRPWLYGLPAGIPWLALGETIYHPPPPVGGMRPASAAVLEAVDPLVERENDVRRRTGDHWLELVRDSARLVAPRVAGAARPGWLRFPLVVEPGLRETFRARGALARGVMWGYPGTLDRLEGFGRRLHAPADFPGARTLAAQLFSLPTHGLLAESDRSAIAELVRRNR